MVYVDSAAILRLVMGALVNGLTAWSVVGPHEPEPAAAAEGVLVRLAAVDCEPVENHKDASTDLAIVTVTIAVAASVSEGTASVYAGHAIGSTVAVVLDRVRLVETGSDVHEVTFGRAKVTVRPADEPQRERVTLLVQVTGLAQRVTGTSVVALP